MSIQERKGWETPMMSIDIKMIRLANDSSIILCIEKSLQLALTCIQIF